jgi:ubiquinone/menaquinone biosynthesis C-methylase UbiE
MDDPQPSLDRIFELFTAYQRTAAVRAAVELDLFTAIAEGADTVPALATRTGASPRGVQALTASLAVAGLVEKRDGRWRLGPDAAAFLDRRSPTWLGSMVLFLANPAVAGGFERLADAVRKGGTVVGPEGTLSPEHPVWVEFARHMAAPAALTAELMAGVLGADAGPPWRVLDLAAGHGLFGITLARRNPNARVVAQDWANVLAVARENAERLGVADRVAMLPGSALTVDLGGPYDLVLLTNFLHHFPPAECESLLRRVHAALAPGGRAVALDFVVNEDRVSPPAAAAFSLVMLATTPAGDVYTLPEYEAMFRAAGFAGVERHALPVPQDLLVGRR